MENNESKKQNTPVNEDKLMAIIAEGVRKPGQVINSKEDSVEAIPEPETSKEKPVVREKYRNKKVTDTTYGELFLNTHSMTRRGEKSIYIRPEYHERMSRIVQTIGGDKIPLYAYLDNILAHHFEIFEKAITEDFNSKNKPIF